MAWLFGFVRNSTNSALSAMGSCHYLAKGNCRPFVDLERSVKYQLYSKFSKIAGFQPYEIVS
jgi:hypothetical protein